MVTLCIWLYIARSVFSSVSVSLFHWPRNFPSLSLSCLTRILTQTCCSSTSYILVRVRTYRNNVKRKVEWVTISHRSLLHPDSRVSVRRKGSFILSEYFPCLQPSDRNSLNELTPSVPHQEAASLFCKDQILKFTVLVGRTVSIPSSELSSRS